MRMILIFLMTFSTFAQSIKLNKDQPAPFTGVLLKKEFAERLVKAEKQTLLLKDLRVAQEDLTEYHRQDAKDTRKKLSEAKFDSYLNTIGAFVVGALVTSLVFKVNQKVGDL